MCCETLSESSPRHGRMGDSSARSLVGHGDVSPPETSPHMTAATVQLSLALAWRDAGHGNEGLLAAFQLSVACDLAQATGESPRRFGVGQPHWEPDGVAISVSICNGSGAQRVPAGLLAMDLQEKASDASSALLQGAVTQHLQKIAVLDATHAPPQRATSVRDSQLAAVEQSLLLAAEEQVRTAERQLARSSAVEPRKGPSLQPTVEGEIETLRNEVDVLRARELEQEVALNRKAARVNQLQDEVSACVLCRGGHGECGGHRLLCAPLHLSWHLMLADN